MRVFRAIASYHICYRLDADTQTPETVSACNISKLFTINFELICCARDA